MSNFLYFLAILLIIFWVLGYYVYSVGALIHFLLVLAIIAALIRAIRGK